MQLKKNILISHKLCGRQSALYAKGQGAAFESNFFTEQGVEVTEAAAKFFGAQFRASAAPAEEARALTDKNLNAGLLVAEATFVGDDCIIRCDLARLDGGEISFVEVKSSLSTSDNVKKHLDDVAAQIVLLERAGYAVRQAEIAMLNPEAIGPADPALFIKTDVTAEATVAARELDADAAIAAIAEVPPQKFCKECTKCEFFRNCWPQYPERHATTDIPRLHFLKLEKLHNAGIYKGTEVAAELLSEKQLKTVECWLGGEPVIDESGFDKDFPIPPGCKTLHFLDFEAVQPAIPLFDSHKPYQKIPFQFSMHTAQIADGGKIAITQHREFLHTKKDDPTPFFLRALIEATEEDNAPIVVYTSFEKGTLANVAKAEPKYADAALQISERFIDLYAGVSRHVNHPDFNGGYSIKVVLPAFDPEFTYSNLAVQDGIQAVKTWLDLRRTGDGDNTDAARDLRKYCALDTEAMIKVLVGIFAMQQRTRSI